MQDAQWLTDRAAVNAWFDKPMATRGPSASWMHVPERDRFLTYAELAARLIPCKEMGYTHIELLQ